MINTHKAAAHNTAPPAGQAARHGRAGRWLSALALAAALVVSTAAGAAASSAAAALQQFPARQQRDLIRATVIARILEQAVAAELADAQLGPDDPALGDGALRYGIVAYRVLYRTVNATGQPTLASGLVAFPVDHARHIQLVYYGHGTTGYKRDVPSSFGLDASGDGIQGRWSAELFASAGFGIAEPDYVGMGAGRGRPQYMVATSEVSASLDLLRATGEIAARGGAQIDPGVQVTGFSQGGSAAMALGRALQQGAEKSSGLYLCRAPADRLLPTATPYEMCWEQAVTGACRPGGTRLSRKYRACTDDGIGRS